MNVRKLKKEIKLTIKIKIMSDEDRGKEYMRKCYYKRKNMLNHLINYVEVLRKVNFKK